jgi:hypothetical protein
MSQSKNRSSISNTTIPADQIDSPVAVTRPYKIQKLQIPNSTYAGHYTSFHYQHGESFSDNQHIHQQDDLNPAQNQESQHKSEEIPADPFFYY